MKYIQCELQNNKTKLVTYIPKKYCKVGLNLTLKNEVGNWLVNKVFKDSETEESNLPDSKKAIKEHRKNTGDSLKK